MDKDIIRFLKVLNENSGKYHVVDSLSERKGETLCGLTYWNYQFDCPFYNYLFPEPLVSLDEVHCNNCGYVLAKNIERYLVESPHYKDMLSQVPDDFYFDSPTPLYDKLQLYKKYPELIDALSFIKTDDNRLIVLTNQGPWYYIDLDN